MNGDGGNIYGRDYYKDSKRLREDVLRIADTLKGNPKRFHIKNGIAMDVVITKSDLKTIVGKNTSNNKFNAIKNALAKDIEGYLRKAKYAGWRNTVRGKHSESAYFAYYSRTLGAKTYLCMREMKRDGYFKPYAIIDQKTFDAEIKNVSKKKPPR